jgi:hypothetical protein
MKGVVTNACSSLATAAAVGELAGVSEGPRCVFKFSMTDATRHISGIKMGSEVNIVMEVERLWD